MNLHDKVFKKKTKSLRIHHEENHANSTFSSYLDSLIPNSERPIVIVCIGTDRSTGDSLGPLVGTKLKNRFPGYNIYGTLQSPVHAVNLEETLRGIEQKYRDPFIIGIDACLGKLSSIGLVSAGIGPVRPGAGVHKQLPAVGDIHITGIVNVGGFMEHIVLQNTRLHLVMTMADFIADGLFLSLYKRKPKQFNNEMVSS